MTRKIQIAVTLQVVLILIGMASPLAIRFTGQTLYLETLRVDPRALLRGDYVILGYQIGQEALSPELADLRPEALASTSGRRVPVFAVVTTDRPARLVTLAVERPSPQAGTACVSGFFAPSGVVFPQIAQYFVPEGVGREIERSQGEDLLAVVKVSRRCSAVLVGLEPR